MRSAMRRGTPRPVRARLALFATVAATLWSFEAYTAMKLGSALAVVLVLVLPLAGMVLGTAAAGRRRPHLGRQALAVSFGALMSVVAMLPFAAFAAALIALGSPAV